MKLLVLSFILVFNCSIVVAQSDFMGIVKYKMTVEGDSAKRVDSMAVIFGKDKIKIVMFLPNSDNWKIPREKIFIDDFRSNKTYDIDSENGTYRVSNIKEDSSYKFKNTNRFDAHNRSLCLVYEADAGRLGAYGINRAECLASIDYYKPSIKNYLFLGVQPIVVDGRIVMDYTVTQKNGLKPKVNLYQVIHMENTEKYFNLTDFVEEK